MAISTLSLLLLFGIAGAQTGGEFEITRSVMAGGGQTSGGEYAVTGAIGQPEADPNIATGGEFSVRGGFYSAPTAEGEEMVFSDGFEG